MIKAAIVGATGYTGAELLRLLVVHPHVEIVCITSRAEAGIPVSDIYPSLRGFCELPFVDPDINLLTACDVVFFATPHGVAQAMMAEVLAAGVRVVDLSADFRIKDIALWEKWYQTQHKSPQLVGEAVYGLPELNRAEIVAARLVACPGCYPTAVQIGFIPLIEAGVVKLDSLIANAASGVSGGGRSAKVAMSFSENSDSFKAYASAGHRHMPEIKQTLTEIAGGSIDLVFQPHLVPMIRGIHATLYAELTSDIDLQALFEQRYANEPFVDVLPEGAHPETRSVKASNFCRVSVRRAPESNKVIVMSVIDNLCKGSSGQALQNMNIMFGFDELCGLNTPALMP